MFQSSSHPGSIGGSTMRISSIDIVRGLVMLLMALDHTRFFFSNFKFDPTDLHHAGTPTFLTRWVTHMCAPIFIFLSGTSAYISSSRVGDKKLAARKLFTRGLWLIFLEFTVVRFGWTFDLNFLQVFLQVIWAVGVCMIALSVLIFQPRSVMLIFGLVLILTHNLFDTFVPADNSIIHIIWRIFHVSGPIFYGSTSVVLYPVIPWIGVMVLGYCFGGEFSKAEAYRRRLLLALGCGCVIGFVALRGINMYGDPSPWHSQPAAWRTPLSFINCTKYPPSLQFLLMTMGPAFLLLFVVEKLRNGITNILTVYGRVPLFFYAAHIYFIHALAVIISMLKPASVTAGHFSYHGFSIVSVYLLWLLVILFLYFPCRWFMRLKGTRKDWWLTYL